jgi:hypothetical protein
MPAAAAQRPRAAPAAMAPPRPADPPRAARVAEGAATVGARSSPGASRQARAAARGVVQRADPLSSVSPHWQAAVPAPALSPARIRSSTPVSRRLPRTQNAVFVAEIQMVRNPSDFLQTHGSDPSARASTAHAAGAPPTRFPRFPTHPMTTRAHMSRRFRADKSSADGFASSRSRALEALHRASLASESRRDAFHRVKSKLFGNSGGHTMRSCST